jgi:hypothetical protein
VVLTRCDCTKRKAFAQQCKKILSTKPWFFWRNIAFYLDEVSFVYKTQPLSDALVYGEERARVNNWLQKDPQTLWVENSFTYWSQFLTTMGYLFRWVHKKKFPALLSRKHGRKWFIIWTTIPLCKA